MFTVHLEKPGPARPRRGTNVSMVHNGLLGRWNPSQSSLPNPMTIKWASFSIIFRHALGKHGWSSAFKKRTPFWGVSFFLGKRIGANRLSRSHEINHMKSPCPPQAPGVLRMKKLADALRTGACAQSHSTGQQLTGIPGESQRP